MFYRILFVMSLFFAVISVASAGGEEGTGQSGVQVTVTSDNRLILYADGESFDLLGSRDALNAYSELMLDYLSQDGGFYPNWGKAEVLLGCHVADVLLYQQQPTGWEEIAAMQVATDYCPTDQ